jgi:hypothetical protein
MLTMGGGEAAFFAITVAIIGWARRRIIIELTRPLYLGPFLIRIRPEPHAGPNLVQQRQARNARGP